VANAPKAERREAIVPIRSRYDGSRVRVGVACTAAEDRAKQSFKNDCDINVLMKRFEKTGVLPDFGNRIPQFADVSALDFTESANQVARVRGAFSMLDARTRARFENRPELMLEFIADPSNRAEAVKLGLVKEISDGREEGSSGAGSVGQAGKADPGDGAAGSEAPGDGAGAPGGAAVEQGSKVKR